MRSKHKCPFCDYGDHPYTTRDGWRNRWCVYCLNCEAQGPYMGTEQEALDVWENMVWNMNKWVKGGNKEMKTIYNLEIKAEYRECSKGCGTKRVFVGWGKGAHKYTAIRPDEVGRMSDSIVVPLKGASRLIATYNLESDDIIALLDDEPSGYFECGCDEKKEPEPLPCPNCEGGRGDTYVGHKVIYYVVCKYCGMRGPGKSVEEDAIKKWNNLPRKEED